MYDWRRGASDVIGAWKCNFPPSRLENPPGRVLDPVFLSGSGFKIFMDPDPHPVFKFLWFRFQPPDPGAKSYLLEDENVKIRTVKK